MEERLARITWESLVAETLAFGSPDNRSPAYRGNARPGSGAGNVLDELRGLSQERVRRSMELFAREVMPRFR